MTTASSAELRANYLDLDAGRSNTIGLFEACSVGWRQRGKGTIKKIGKFLVRAMNFASQAQEIFFWHRFESEVQLLFGGANELVNYIGFLLDPPGIVRDAVPLSG